MKYSECSVFEPNYSSYTNFFRSGTELVGIVLKTIKLGDSIGETENFSMLIYFILFISNILPSNFCVEMSLVEPWKYTSGWNKWYQYAWNGAISLKFNGNRLSVCHQNKGHDPTNKDLKWCKYLDQNDVRIYAVFATTTTRSKHIKM